MARELLIGRDIHATVDDEDYGTVSAVRWTVRRKPNGTVRACHYYSVDGIRKYVDLGWFILRPLPGYIVDHISGDPLDNRRANLRIATVAQNVRNRAKHANGRHPYKGVKASKGAFEAWVTCEYVKHYAGRYATVEEAARGYDRAAKRLHGDFARLNFPEAA
jgi:hypothetical protein